MEYSFLVLLSLMSLTLVNHQTVANEGSVKDRFFRAVEEDDVEQVKVFLAFNTSQSGYQDIQEAVFSKEPCQRNGDVVLVKEATALMIAAEQGHVAVAQALIDAGARVNAVQTSTGMSNGGYSVLAFAVCSQSSNKQAMLKLLLDNGATNPCWKAINRKNIVPWKTANSVATR